MIPHIVFAFFTFTSQPNSPHAYLDPGSGSFILQLLIAALLGGLFIVKTYWKRIVAFFNKEKPEDQDDQQE